MSVVLHISDTHFGTEVPAVVEALQRLAQRERPTLVVLSGDITQRARPAQFQAAMAFVQKLGAPVLAVPGNHDIPLLNLWARWRAPYAHYAAAFGAELEPVHRSAGLLVLGVNTTRAWRHKHGEVSAQQTERVAQQLAGASAAQLRIVVVHQPVAVVREQDALHRLRGHQQALQRWASAGADLVLGGHIHLPYLAPIDGLQRPLWGVQAGTAVSSRVRPGVPQSVNVLRWDGGSGVCGVERWHHSVGEGEFVRGAVSALRVGRG